jgi:hypothetical protein
VLMGCSPSGDDIDALDVEFALDSVEVSQSEVVLFVASTDVLDPKTTADNAPKAAAAAAKLIFQPPSCVTTVITGTAITYTLNNCTGPFKLRRIDGEVEVVYSVGASGLHAQATAKELRIDAITLDISSEGLFSKSGTSRKLSVETHGTGVGLRGHRVARDGEYTVTWDKGEGCWGFEGAFETRVGLRRSETTVEGFSRCIGECPRAGGRIVYGGARVGDRITIDFDGTSTVRWASSRGTEGTVELLCGGGGS